MKMKVHWFSVHCKKMATGIDPYRKWQSFVQTGSEKNFEPEVKSSIFGKLVKVFKEFYSSFLISCYLTAVNAFEVLSVAMTSSPEIVRNKKIMNLLVFEPTEFNS